MQVSGIAVLHSTVFPRGERRLRTALCVVRGSPPGGRRTHTERSARRAPHHEGVGSSRRTAGERRLFPRSTARDTPRTALTPPGAGGGSAPRAHVRERNPSP